MAWGVTKGCPDRHLHLQAKIKRCPWGPQRTNSVHAQLKEANPKEKTVADFPGQGVGVEWGV